MYSGRGVGGGEGGGGVGVRGGGGGGVGGFGGLEERSNNYSDDGKRRGILTGEVFALVL